MHHPNQEHTFNPNLLMGLGAGLLIGSVAGAGAMLLLAPQSGKKTRAQIQHTGVELRDQTTEAVEDAVGRAGVKARQIRAGVRRQARHLEHRGQVVLEEQKERLSTLVEDGQKALHGS